MGSKSLTDKGWRNGENPNHGTFYSRGTKWGSTTSASRKWDWAVEKEYIVLTKMVQHLHPPSVRNDEPIENPFGLPLRKRFIEVWAQVGKQHQGWTSKISRMF